MTQAIETETQSLSALLRAGSDALDLSLLPRQVEQLLHYLALLGRWNAVHNLSATHEASQIVFRHLFDSLAIIRPLIRYGQGRALTILDVGTGAGLPAVVLAVIQPTWQVTAVDSVAKKVAFVRQVAGELALENLIPAHTRVETLQPLRPFEVVVSRAFSSLSKFVDCTQHLLVPDGVWLAMKGKRPETELTELGKDFTVIHVEPLLVPRVAAQRCLVWIGRAEPDRR